MRISDSTMPKLPPGDVGEGEESGIGFGLKAEAIVELLVDRRKKEESEFLCSPPPLFERLSLPPPFVSFGKGL